MNLSEILNIIKMEKIVDVSSCEDFIRTGVTNNKIYLLNKGSEKKYILKVYYLDERKRLEREYAGYDFFTQLGSDFTPKPIYKNVTGYFAVYTFLGGDHKKPEDVTQNDMVKISNFLIYMHKNSQKAHEKGLKFMPAIASCFSIEETLNKINMKLGKFLSDESLDKYEVVEKFRSHYDIKKLFEDLIVKSLDKTDDLLIKTKLPIDKQTLSPVDFNFTNMLFNGEKMHFLDFEDFGWDDPVNIFAFFLYHDKVTGLSYENKKILIDDYLSKADVSVNFIKRLKIMLNLGGVVWLATYLLAMTEEKIKVRLFSDPNFEPTTYIASRIAAFEAKIEEINSKHNLANIIEKYDCS